MEFIVEMNRASLSKKEQNYAGHCSLQEPKEKFVFVHWKKHLIFISAVFLWCILFDMPQKNSQIFQQDKNTDILPHLTKPFV